MKILAFAFCKELDVPTAEHPSGNRGNFSVQELETYFTYTDSPSDIQDFLYQWFNFKIDANHRKAFFQFCVE